ncbi:hypothetical protein NMG60_11016787 [Bertholletia excelsa]
MRRGGPPSIPPYSKPYLCFDLGFYLFGPVSVHLRRSISHHQMAVRVWDAGLAFLVAVVCCGLTCAETDGVSSFSVCPGQPVTDLSSVFGFQVSRCPVNGDESVRSFEAVGVTEVCLILVLKRKKEKLEFFISPFYSVFILLLFFTTNV